MRKPKTADVNTETAAPAEPKRRSSAAKSQTVPAATHKRPATRRAKEAPADAVAEVVAVGSTAAVLAPVAASEAHAPRTPSYAEVAELAYSYWVARGYQGGSADEDWLRAERELTKLS